jgi:cell division protein FtsX
VKSWSNTRWESRIKSVQAIRYQTPQIRSALKALEEVSALDNDPSTVSDCQSLVSALENFEFLVGFWLFGTIIYSL